MSPERSQRSQSKPAAEPTPRSPEGFTQTGTWLEFKLQLVSARPLRPDTLKREQLTLAGGGSSGANPQVA